MMKEPNQKYKYILSDIVACSEYDSRVSLMMVSFVYICIRTYLCSVTCVLVGEEGELLNLSGIAPSSRLCVCSYGIYMHNIFAIITIIIKWDMILDMPKVYGEHAHIHTRVIATTTIAAKKERRRTDDEAGLHV